MTTLTDAPVQERTTASAYRISLGHQIRSEIIKLTSLRSPWWSAAIVVAISVGMAGLYAWASADSEFVQYVTANELYSSATLMSTMFTVLLASIIGTMLVTGEYSTGMIRSTLTAAPDRLRSLVAKVLVVAGFVLVVELLTLVLALAAASIFYAPAGLTPDFSDVETGVLPYVNGALYLALVGVMGVGIGYIIRNGAGAISVIVAIMFVLPMIPGFLSMIPGMEWVLDAARYLPTNAGQDFMIGDAEARTQGGIVLVAWAAVTTVLGAVVLRRKDA